MLARISPENHLIRIQQYFSFMGQISDPAILEQSTQITQFKLAATQMLLTLRKFKDHLDVMEGDFEAQCNGSTQLNKMLQQYE